MTEENQRVFLLYYSGYNYGEIAAAEKKTISQVKYVINSHGKIWVNNYLKDSWKDRIIKLSSQGYNAQAIADELGRPWNRWLVTYTLNRLNLSPEPTQEKKHAVRCSRCSAIFTQTAEELIKNPDRLCDLHAERRIDDRRNLR